MANLKNPDLRPCDVCGLVAGHECKFHRPPKEERCPKCGRGWVLEWIAGWWCSRRYAAGDPCDWIVGGGA